MIVKNESRVIERCLASVKPIIDYWIIVDTGSTDGTQETIREFLKDIPGELHEFPWVDFAHNRNQALALSKGKGDYLLFIDADEQLVFQEPFTLPILDKDYYFFSVRQPSGINYCREELVQNNLDWKWVGPIHETLESPQAKSCAILPGVINLSITEDGYRSQDEQKYLKDAAILEEAIKKEPQNSRFAFYLALSYGNAKEYDKALKWHEKRVEMEGSEQEIFYSLLSIAKILDITQAEPEKVTAAYTKAYLYRPSRAEPLFYLAHYYIQRKNFVLGYLFSKKGLSIPPSTDIIFVQHDIYDTGLAMQFADCSLSIGNYKETLQTYDTLLSNPKLSPPQQTAIQKNIPLVKDLLEQQIKTKSNKNKPTSY